MNILEKISELCETRYTPDSRTNQQLRDIKKIADRDADMLTQILYDYIKQNQDDATYRKGRLKAAQRMLGELQ